MITAKNNSHVKRVALLCASAAKRAESSLFVLEGSRLCSELLRGNFAVQELYYTAAAAQKNDALLQQLCQRACFYTEVSEPVFAKMADTKNPQGILCVVKMPASVNKLPSGRYLAFEQVSDPGNLGAAARTADALGFAGLILTQNGVDPYSPKAMRASMGALLRLPLYTVQNLSAALPQFKRQGFVVSGTVVEKTAKPITKVQFTKNEIAVIGNEANGMTDSARQCCDRLITIPMAGRAESLNAAVAAAIVMWEMCK